MLSPFEIDTYLSKIPASSGVKLTKAMDHFIRWYSQRLAIDRTSMGVERYDAAKLNIDMCWDNLDSMKQVIERDYEKSRHQKKEQKKKTRHLITRPRTLLGHIRTFLNSPWLKERLEDLTDKMVRGDPTIHNKARDMSIFLLLIQSSGHRPVTARKATIKEWQDVEVKGTTREPRWVLWVAEHKT